MLPASWTTQSTFVAPVGGQLAAGALAGDRLVLADVADGAELRRPVAAGVDGDDRDAGVHGRLDRVLQRVGVGHRDHDAVDALVDRGVDELRLALRVAVALVVDGDAEVLAGGLGAVLDDVPERVTGRAVRDDREAEVAAARRRRRCRRRRAAAVRSRRRRWCTRARKQRRGQRDREQSPGCRAMGVLLCSRSAAPPPPGVAQDHACRAAARRGRTRARARRTGDIAAGDLGSRTWTFWARVTSRSSSAATRSRAAGGHRHPLDGPGPGARRHPLLPVRHARTPRSPTRCALSRAMSYKNSLAGLDLGGGKAVIIGDPRTDKTEALLRAYGRFVEALGGRYLTACDVGTYNADLDVVARETRFAHGRSEAYGGCGDSSVLTAYGVFQGMRAAAQHCWGSPVAGRPHRRRGRRRQGRLAPGRPPGRRRRRRRRHRRRPGRGRAACAPGTPQVQAVRRHRRRWSRTPHDVYAPCALGGALDDGDRGRAARRGSSAAARTTSWPRPGSPSSCAAAASSTPPTTW